jgi:hypothetical protein
MIFGVQRRMKSSRGMGLRLVPRLVVLSEEEAPVEQLHSLPEKELRLEGRKKLRPPVQRRDVLEPGVSGKLRGESIVDTENRDRGSLENGVGEEGGEGFTTTSSSSMSAGTSSGTLREGSGD